MPAEAGQGARACFPGAHQGALAGQITSSLTYWAPNRLSVENLPTFNIMENRSNAGIRLEISQ